MERAITAVRGAAASVAVLVVWHVVSAGWRDGEAAFVRLLLAAVGVSSARVGDQLMVRGDTGSFVASIGPWCSSLGPVLLFGALATLAPAGRRVRSALVASGIVLVANIGRLVAVIAIGALTDTAALERWHDSVGVGVAIVSSLGAGGWLVSRLWPMPGVRPARAAPPLVQP